MGLRKVADEACPADIVAVAINGKTRQQHCGIIFTDAAGVTKFCDMQWEHTLGVSATISPQYFWARVRLAPEEVLQISEFIELIIEQAAKHPHPYSFVYSANGFDVAGKIRNGVGLTCATFIVGIFDHFDLSIVDLSTWRARPVQDAAFQQRIMEYALAIGQRAVAARLLNERPAFRLKPWEICGSASHSRYPVRFRQGAKLAKQVARTVRPKRP